MSEVYQMNIRRVCKIETGLSHLEEACDVPMREIIEALKGICFDEEEVGELLEFISNEY